MKYFIVMCCVVATAIAENTTYKYTDKYDNVNPQEILKNKHMTESFAACLREQGPCTPMAKEFKEHIKDAIATGCSKCTDKQKQEAPQAIKLFKEMYPELWKEALEKYDPTGEWRKKYEEEAKKLELE